MERFSKCIKQNLFKPFISRCALRRFLRYGSAFKVGNAVLVQALVLAGFLAVCRASPAGGAALVPSLFGLQRLCRKRYQLSFFKH